MNRVYVVLSLLLIFSVIPSTLQFQCKSDTGKNVDWWVAFKHPKGRTYDYSDSTIGGSLSTSKFSFSNGSSSCLNYTLSQLFGKPAGSLSYGMINDQPPQYGDAEIRMMDKREAFASLQKAHAKGVIAMDNFAEGFWLLHSIPKYPLSPVQYDSFTYPGDSQVKYAQSLLCVSFEGWNTFNNIGVQLQVYKPQVYPSSISLAAQSNAKDFFLAIDAGTYVNNRTKSIKELKSKGGMTFKSFAKTGAWGRGWDMYSEFIAPALRQPMLVETWRKGAGDPLPSNCTSQYKIVNVENLHMGSDTWKYTNDHSKWGIGTSSGSKYVCICGVNRMASQGSRGGGGICFLNNNLHSSLSAKIVSEESCL